mmetsp:Transcript_20189/g.22357  ORF Transcript_20189/g.22357 Transcript_20189/m.22357 type:complete len:80 (-) Transcript_20189:564-803(-)
MKKRRRRYHFERKIDLVRVHERKTNYCSSLRRSDITDIIIREIPNIVRMNRTTQINKHDKRYRSSTNEQHNKDSSISKQ